MQNQVYSRYLYQALMEFGVVCVPSLGTFSLSANESEFNENRSKLNPPSTKINFSKSEDQQNTLEKLLINSGLDDRQSNMVQSVIINDYSKSISENLPFTLEGLGTVVNHFFVEKEAGVFNRYRGLKAINIIPVVSGKIPIGPIIQTASHYIKSSKSKSNYSNYIIPSIIALLTLFAIAFWVLNQTNTNDSIPTNEVVEETIQNGNDIDANQLINDTLLGGSEPIDSGETIDILNKGETTVLNKPTEVIVDPKNSEECVVVVGSFKSESNVKKMLSKINKKGYKVFTQKHNGLNRVGVAYDCTHNDPDMFKTKIKTQFNKDAWHLHDTLKK